MSEYKHKEITHEENPNQATVRMLTYKAMAPRDKKVSFENLIPSWFKKKKKR